MVSRRCLLKVEEVLLLGGYHVKDIKLGEATIRENLSIEQLRLLNKSLLVSGLCLINDKTTLLTERIKNTVVEIVHYTGTNPKTNFSLLLSRKLNYNYTYLSNVFSEHEGLTIEHFMLLHKIERVKELIIYDELNFTQIAYKLNYSSVSHLSKQFKKMTGLTPTSFKNLKNRRRKPLEDM